MSEVISGYVRKINTKQGVGKRGPWTLFSVKMTNEDGSAERDPWYSAGFKAPAFIEGDYISATVKAGSKEGYFDLSDGKKIDAPKQQAAAPAGGNATPVGMPATNKDKSIAYQSARNAAIEAVRLQVDKGGLVLPKKTADVFAVIHAAVDKLTVQYYHDVQTMRLLETVADGGALEEPPGEASAAAAGDDSDD